MTIIYLPRIFINRSSMNKNAIYRKPDCMKCKYYDNGFCKKFKYDDGEYEYAYVCRNMELLCGIDAAYYIFDNDFIETENII